MKETDFVANLSQGKQGVGNPSGITYFSRKMKLYPYCLAFMRAAMR